jgi:glycosyltransferase involved in cell wall biosynthesis
MVDEYERRYGVMGAVLYPSRALDTPCFDKCADNDASIIRPFTLAFAGNLYIGDYIRQLVALSRMLGKIGGKLLLFGPFDLTSLMACGINADNVLYGGLIQSAELVRRLRQEADVLFLPESFEEAQAGTIDLSFPSKLTDYTATALPILIWGPKISAAVMWANSEPGVAAIVTEANENVMAAMLAKLASDQEWRRSLGATAADVGKRYFSPQRAQTVFYQALC